MEPEYEKILFRFYSEIFDKEMTESMWAIVIDRMKGLYKIDNIPSYIPMIAPDDIIVAEFDNKEGFITYKRIVITSYSIHYTKLYDDYIYYQSVSDPFGNLDLHCYLPDGRKFIDRRLSWGL